MINKRRTGTYYESVAKDYLISLNFRILDQNFRIRSGEIDLIAEENGILSFVEVKYRSSLRYGRPCEAVTRKKQTTIIRTSEYWMMVHHQTGRIRRYDIVEILGNEVSLIRNAFGGF